MSQKKKRLRVVRRSPDGHLTVNKRADKQDRMVRAKVLPSNKEVDQRDPSPAVGEPVSDLVGIRYAAGRTISLGSFSFARIFLKMSVSVARKDTELGYAHARAVVDEIVNRETALLRGEARPAVALSSPTAIQVWAPELSLDYGLTIPTQRFESSKVDVGITRPIGDGEELEAAAKDLQAWCQAQITNERERIVGESQSKETGL